METWRGPFGPARRRSRMPSLNAKSSPSGEKRSIRGCSASLPTYGRWRASSTCASELITRARRLMTEMMRLRKPLMFAAQSAAALQALAGDSDAAERELQAALEMALDFQERNEASKIAAELSRVLSIEGRPREAETFATTSADHAHGRGCGPGPVACREGERNGGPRQS